MRAGAHRPPLGDRGRRHLHIACLKELVPDLHDLLYGDSFALQETLGHVWGPFWFPEMMLKSIRCLWALKASAVPHAYGVEVGKSCFTPGLRGWGTQQATVCFDLHWISQYVTYLIPQQVEFIQLQFAGEKIDHWRYSSLLSFCS